MKALEEFQLPFESALVHMGGITSDSGYVITNELLVLSEKPTAIFIGSNFQLLGTLRALRENKIHIPQDISLICFDDTEWGCFADPPLTVVEPDTINFSKTAVELLFERINGLYSGEKRQRIIPTRLVERNSVARVD